jgi:adenine-specific DNA-methyltransferase
MVGYILILKKQNQNSTFFERLIDAMVYELYLPEAILVTGAEVLKYLNNLPVAEEGEDEPNLKTIEKVYKELSDQKHPVSLAMFKMDTIEEIAIIEGKK